MTPRIRLSLMGLSSLLLVAPAWAIDRTVNLAGTVGGVDCPNNESIEFEAAPVGLSNQDFTGHIRVFDESAAAVAQNLRAALQQAMAIKGVAGYTVGGTGASIVVSSGPGGPDIQFSVFDELGAGGRLDQPVTVLGITFIPLPAGPHLHQVAMAGNALGNFHFDPDSIQIVVGDTIRWTNTSPGLIRHTTTSGMAGAPDSTQGLLWDSPLIPSGQSFTLAWSRSGLGLSHRDGVEGYFCRPHEFQVPPMDGKVVVNPIVKVLVPPQATVAPGQNFNLLVTATNNTATTERIQGAVHAVLPNGNIRPVVPPTPPGGVNLPGGRTAQGTLTIHIPNNAPNITVDLVTSILSQPTGDTLDTDVTALTVQGPAGSPAAGRGASLVAGEALSLEAIGGTGLFALARVGEAPTLESGRSAEAGGLPRAYTLAANTPNPFNPSTTIRYAVPAGAGRVAVRLTIFTLRGERVRTLVDEEQGPGIYQVHWDGRTERGESVSSGVYLYRLSAGPFTSLRKMVLLR